jgi:hypothetical protein
MGIRFVQTDRQDSGVGIEIPMDKPHANRIPPLVTYTATHPDSNPKGLQPHSSRGLVREIPRISHLTCFIDSKAHSKLTPL